MSDGEPRCTQPHLGVTRAIYRRLAQPRRYQARRAEQALCEFLLTMYAFSDHSLPLIIRSFCSQA